MDDLHCPICKRRGFQVISRTTVATEGKCRTCGHINIDEAAIHMVNGGGGNQTHLISAYYRQLEPGSPVTLINSENVKQILAGLPSSSTAEKMDRLLRLCAQKTLMQGQYSEFDWTLDYPLLSVREEEMVFYVDELVRQNFVIKGPSRVLVTVTGFKEIESKQRSGRESEQAFVAMWFDNGQDEVYSKVIEPAILQAGYDPLRVDKKEHVNRIDDEIIAGIRTSRFMVADFTGQRPGVYFEAGMMLGLRRNVIWMCEDSERNKLHFDTRQYNFIFYQDFSDAKARLLRRILAMEGEGPKLKKNK